MSETEQPDLTTLTVQLLSAYLGNNTVASEAIPDLIQSTRSALAGAPAAEELAEPEYVPAVSIRKSLASRDFILSMIDGKPYKTLKRHVATHSLTLAEYRERYKLPASYPSVAPAYSEFRRVTAAQSGLGRKPVGVPDVGAVEAPETGQKATPVAGKTIKAAKKKVAKQGPVGGKPEKPTATPTTDAAPDTTKTLSKFAAEAPEGKAKKPIEGKAAPAPAPTRAKKAPRAAPVAASPAAVAAPIAEDVAAAAARKSARKVGAPKAAVPVDAPKPLRRKLKVAQPS
jgi:predicted transcriptional regulator